MRVWTRASNPQHHLTLWTQYESTALMFSRMHRNHVSVVSILKWTCSDQLIAASSQSPKLSPATTNDLDLSSRNLQIIPWSFTSSNDTWKSWVLQELAPQSPAVCILIRHFLCCIRNITLENAFNIYNSAILQIICSKEVSNSSRRGHV